MTILKLVGISLLVFSLNTHAGYDANMVGKITSVMTYSSGSVLFSLDTQPKSHPQCTPTFFAISANTKESIINRFLSRLLAAYTTKETINIGFDSQGDCAENWIRVHRIG
ncbi:hypothetical protein [Photobacterium damselae]|uniref:Uncharacterized protein n=1 Tax=Photobacterium damselae TaxID=38293 RepID=A0A2T3Q9W5_PHODM|nr:hypothetical protein [Photobacterium damselae]PSW80799.1 hypothetical protein CTN07_19730 [Photobacterium damselae]SPY46104.1 Uncharacterised protein [Photobacterium damselae]